MKSERESSRNPFAFANVEELEEAVRALGWTIEYRQLGPGAFSAEFAFLECDAIRLLTARFTNHLDIPCECPAGYIGICLPRLDAGRADVCGREMNGGDLAVIPARSAMEFVTRGEIRNETLFLREADFLAAVRSLAPSTTLISPGGPAAIIHGDRGHLEAIVREMDALHGNGGLDREIASNLLAQTVLCMTNASGNSSARRLSNGGAAVIARRARNFIEDHLRDPIRMEDVCTHTGAGLRTVQRCFASQYQIGPIAYIKARRLNAARRALAAAEPRRDSVTTIAMDHGFNHLGRFSVDYRAHFGESPRETLAS